MAKRINISVSSELRAEMKKYKAELGSISAICQKALRAEFDKLRTKEAKVNSWLGELAPIINGGAK